MATVADVVKAQEAFKKLHPHGATPTALDYFIKGYIQAIESKGK